MTSESIYGVAWAISLYSFAISFAVSEAPLVALHPADRAAYGLATAVSLAAFTGAYIIDTRRVPTRRLTSSLDLALSRLARGKA